jgi:hypothetical protein
MTRYQACIDVHLILVVETTSCSGAGRTPASPNGCWRRPAGRTEDGVPFQEPAPEPGLALSDGLAEVS